MKIYTFLCAVLPLLLADERLLDYYENMINAEIQRAATYQFPKDASSYRPNNLEPKDFGLFDFVVVGAGSAGAIAASRLSEVSKWSVLLLETGKEGSDFTEVPAMSKYSINLEYNWGFNSTPQTNCCQSTGGICKMSTGKSLGGGTTINSLIYSRGNKADYNKWASNWSYEKVLPYFIKSERSQVEGDFGYHGFNGYLNVERVSHISKKTNVFLAAHQELGLSTVDVNGRDSIGVAYSVVNTVKGRRLSTDKAFLQPARSRPNFTILAKSYVEKVLIDEQTKTVIGVLFSSNNTRYIARVKKEVVLSAGAIGSPHILMHSGIGPKHHLKDVNITVVKDLEVGHHMYDHIVFPFLFLKSNMSDTLLSLRESLKQYLNGTGPLTFPSNIQALSFVQLLPSNFKVPDFELTFIPYSTQNVHISNLLIALLHPKSRGRVYLQSNDPFIYPLIDPKCFSDNEDLEKMLQIMKKSLELLETKAFKSIDAKVIPEPNCATHEFNSRDYWLCAVRWSAMTSFHTGGTCQMGTVVDQTLKVYGVKGLRVADTSVIPVTISGHTSAPAMMVGERVADFIKLEHNG